MRTNLNQLAPDTTYMLNVNLDKGGKCSSCGDWTKLSAPAVYRGMRKGRHLFRYVTPQHCPHCGAELLEYMEES